VWSYDDLYRPTDVEYPNTDEINYGYDDVGNRTSLTINGTTTTNTFDNADCTTTSGSGSRGYYAKRLEARNRTSARLASSRQSARHDPPWRGGRVHRYRAVPEVEGPSRTPFRG
jgi:hypothetical protein